MVGALLLPKLHRFMAAAISPKTQGVAYAVRAAKQRSSSSHGGPAAAVAAVAAAADAVGFWEVQQLFLLRPPFFSSTFESSPLSLSLLSRPPLAPFPPPPQRSFFLPASEHLNPAIPTALIASVFLFDIFFRDAPLNGIHETGMRAVVAVRMCDCSGPCMQC